MRELAWHWPLLPCFSRVWRWPTNRPSALKVAIKPGTKELPVDWPAMRKWRASYRLMGGEECEGFTCCTVVSPDLKVEYGNTGSAFVWEMFDSIAYDAKKFAAMLDRSVERARDEQAILADDKLSPEERDRRLAAHRTDVKIAIVREGHFHLPPKGFSVKGAIELFELSGDLPKKK